MKKERREEEGKQTTFNIIEHKTRDNQCKQGCTMRQKHTKSDQSLQREKRGSEGSSSSNKASV